MADATQENVTILGPDASFKGELTFEKNMRLQGRFEGKITTPGRVQVAKEAKMQADVDAGAIVVEGDVAGNLTATDRVELKASARYQGDLRATKLVVDEGAIFVGHVSVGPDVTNKPRPAATATPAATAPMGAPRVQVDRGVIDRAENKGNGQPVPAAAK